jgi:hypothetical protein
MLKEFITSQKAFNKNVEEKLEKLDSLSLKVDNIAHDVEMLKIRTSPLEDEKVKPLNSVQVIIDENIRMLAQLKARWAREREEEERAKNLSMNTTLATIHVIEDLKTFNTHHTPSPSNGPSNGNVEASTLGQKNPTISESVKVTIGNSVESGVENKMVLDNSTPTLIEGSDLNFDNCNLSEVIQFLQKMAKDPHTSTLNMAFTEHITNALIKAREEKLRLEVSIPRKLEDGWDHY